MLEPERIEAQRWLDRARDDLGAATKLLRGSDPYPATAAYHCQQAAEKALKAVLAGAGQQVPKTHDLRVLVERAALTDPRLRALQDLAEQLTPLATEYRYPSDLPDPTPDETRQALAMARDFCTLVAEHIDWTGDSSHATQSS